MTPRSPAVAWTAQFCSGNSSSNAVLTRCFRFVSLESVDTVSAGAAIVTATRNYTLPSIRSKRGVNPSSPPYQAYFYPQVRKGARSHTVWEGDPSPDLCRGRDASPTVGTPCRFINSLFPSLLRRKEVVGCVKRNSSNDVRFHVSLWKPNDIQDSMCRA